MMKWFALRRWIVLLLCFIICGGLVSVRSGIAIAATTEVSPPQDALKKACIEATITAIKMEMIRSQPGTAPEKLPAELEKFQNMNVADYELPEKNMGTAWMERQAGPSSILYVDGMSKSGPWYHISGIVGEDYSRLKPDAKYTITYYKVYPRVYWNMSSYYIYVADINGLPAPAGWDGKGHFSGGDVFEFCSITSDTAIDQYWQTPYGGGNDPTFSIVKSQNSFNMIWAKLRIAPEKPIIDFTKYFLVVIQPGQSITQYNYNLSIRENPTEIKFSLSEYHTAKDRGVLMSQEPILAFKLPNTNKTINVEIVRAPGSEGPYPK